jgi:hypothetical protein
MFPEKLPQALYRYFILSGNLTIPGLGRLSMCRVPAINDFIGKKIIPFSYVVRYDRWDESQAITQLRYLEKSFGESPEEAKSMMQELGTNLHIRLQKDKKLDWMGIGTFLLDDDGEIVFHQKNSPISTHKDVRYQHVLREKIVHPVVVGETEMTSTEVEEILEEKSKPKKRWGWKLTALVLFVVSLSIIGFKVFTGNFDVFQHRYSPWSPSNPPTLNALIK